MNLTLLPEELNPLLTTLTESNLEFSRLYPGFSGQRQPIHTVYGGAQLYSAASSEKLGRLARANLSFFAPDFVTFARALGFRGAETMPVSAEAINRLTTAMETKQQKIQDANPDAWLAHTVYQRVLKKLEREPVEDNRIDFEDGYGNRQDEEEDRHAIDAAKAMAEGMEKGSLPPFTGIRIKAFTEEARDRSIRTLDLFLSALAQASSGQLPPEFAVTLPKVSTQQQVAALAGIVDLLESKCGFPRHSIKLEIMIETTQAILSADGRSIIPALIKAGAGRCSSVIFGTYDYTASCNIASTHQSHMHPAAEFARNVIQVSTAGTGVMISDGITNTMPIPPHKATPDQPLNQQQISENFAVVHAAWKLHFDNIIHSLELGFYQGWDLNPAQIPIRFAAVYYFFLTGLADATARLSAFLDKAAQATLVGNVFDDAATGQGLLNFFLSGMSCGAITEDEALATGITIAELHSRSFLKIVNNRTNG